MDKSDRLRQRLQDLEAEYGACLTAALRECAAGQWGLFGHNEHITGAVCPPVGELMELGEQIDALRSRLLEEPYALHARFVAARGPAGDNDVGEPRKAQLWLKQFEARMPTAAS